jgi:hypothetical protein
VFGLVRSIITVVALLAFIIIGTTVPLGKHTLFGHIVRIWKSDEARDLVDGVKEKGEPVVDRVTKGVKAGLKEARSGGDGGPEPILDEAKQKLESEAKEAARDQGKKAVLEELEKK